MYIQTKFKFLNQPERFDRGQLFLAFVLLTPFFIKVGGLLTSYGNIKIAEVDNYSIHEKRDIYSTFDTDNQKDQGLPIDPIDLMNRLNRAGAMDNATTPSDALDEAINAFDHSEYENVPIE